jgi:hypothetical protein
VSTQPERFYYGDNWAGRVYVMSERNLRQRQRILNALTQPEVALSHADLLYLYAVLAYTDSREHSYQGIGNYGTYETYYQLSPRSPYWKKVVALFATVGINKIPSYEKAWSGS